MKNRLTNEQRAGLMTYLETRREELAKYNNEDKAMRAWAHLGFKITAGNVGYALHLIDADEDAGVPDEAAQYAESSATHLHGRVRPHQLTAFQREVELLERVRRLEVILCKMSNHLGLERKPQSQPKEKAEEQSTFRSLFGGFGARLLI